MGRIEAVDRIVRILEQLHGDMDEADEVLQEARHIYAKHDPTTFPG